MTRIRVTEEMDLALMKAYRAAGGWVPGEFPDGLKKHRLVKAEPGHSKITQQGERFARRRAEKKWGVRL